MKKIPLLIVLLFLSIYAIHNSFALSNIVITPNSWASPNGEYPSSYNATTGITSFTSLPSGSSSSQIIPSAASFIIQAVNGGYWGINGTTGIIQFANSDCATTIQAALYNLPLGGTVSVKDLKCYLSHNLGIPNYVNLIGNGMDSTIFIRNNNMDTDIIDQYGNYSHISGFSVNGNWQNNQNTKGAEDISITGYGDKADNIKSYNYAHSGFAIQGQQIHLSDCFVYGNSSSPNASYGIWSASKNNIVSIQNCDIEHNQLSAVYLGGISDFSHNYVSDNHKQISPVGGGQIAADCVNNIVTTINNNIIQKGGGSYTAGIEIGCNSAIISNNQILNQRDDGIDLDQGPMNVIICSNLILNTTRVPINNNGYNYTNCGNIIH